MSWVQFLRIFSKQSLDTGEISKEWSLANISPLYEKGDRALASVINDYGNSFV